MKRDPITTHVLDTSRGQPASDIPVSLSRCAGEFLEVLGSGHTDDDGRIMNGLVAEAGLEVGVYEIRFDVAGYFKQLSQTS
ncbi:MAG: hydroxyisourate hydrolase, partial [Planctomycetota bacterium]